MTRSGTFDITHTNDWWSKQIYNFQTEYDKNILDKPKSSDCLFYPSEIVKDLIDKYSPSNFRIIDNQVRRIDMAIETGFVPRESEVTKAKRALKYAEEVEKAEKQQKKNRKKVESEIKAHKKLANKTLSDIASGKTTKNTEDRVEAARAILELSV